MTTTSWPETFSFEQVVRTAQALGGGALQRGFLLPLGIHVWANPAADQNELKVDRSTDGGLTWTTLTYLVDWTFMVRSYGAWPVSRGTSDVSSGAFLTTGVASGTLIRLTWKTGFIHIPPPEASAVLLTGGAIDLTVGIRSYNGALVPNGFMSPQRAGLQIELWRWGFQTGRRYIMPVTGYNVLHPGKRYNPYYRFAVAAAGTGELFVQPSTLVGLGFSAPSSKTQSFRLCYYNPLTGARSPLSDHRINWQTNRSDRIAGGVVHPSQSVWISRV